MERQYVGIDFHRRRSVIVRKNTAGEKLGSVRVANEPLAIAAALADAGPHPEVVIEATYGCYWIVDWLQAQGATVHWRTRRGLRVQGFIATLRRVLVMGISIRGFVEDVR